MKQCLTAAVVCLLLFALCFSAAAESRIMVVSDTHYLASTLYEPDSPYFLSVVSVGASKATQYSSELLDALLAEARHQQPDVLLITGDLTFCGEKASHEELSAALRTLEADGIRVVVIPGNHDINGTGAAAYSDTGETPTETVTSAEFGAIWQDMLADELRGPGFCGVVKVRDDLWLAVGDYSVYEDHTEEHGKATEEHLTWISGVMDAAAESGAEVISVSHQPLLSHTDVTSHKFMVHGGDRVADILVAGGTRLNLSGHMHIQQILEAKCGLTDITSGAWCILPVRYAIVTVADDGAIDYQSYAACEEHLPEGYAETVSAFFETATRKGLRAQLMAMGVFDQQNDDMVAFAIKANECYFAGTMLDHPELFDDPALALWQQYERSSTFAQYLVTFMKESTRETRVWHSAAE